MGVRRNLQFSVLGLVTLLCCMSSASSAFARQWPYEEGFHLRSSIGFGASGSAVKSGFVPSAGQELDGVLRGVVIVGELFIEHVVARRVLVGGIVYSQVMFGPQLDEISWAEGDGGDIVFNGANMLMAGATASIHFDNGTFVTGSAGLVWWSTLPGEAEETDVTLERHSGPGFGLVPGVGHEWLGAERSIGVLFQLLVGSVQARDDAGTEWRYQLLMPAILLTVALH
jgi:hypothetical protein